MRWGKFVAVASGVALAALLAAIALHTCTTSSHDAVALGESGFAGSAQGTRTGAHHGALASIRGTVADVAHVAIPYGRVCAAVQDEGPPRTETRDPRCVTANERGAYELDELLATEYVVSALADGHLPAQLEPFQLHAGERRDNVDITLQPGGVLVTGTVSDLGGGPIAHAHVTAFSTLDYHSTASVETDEAGSFHMTVWPNGIGLSAFAEGYTQQYAWGIAPGSFAIELIPASTITGTVVDARNHMPVPDAIVELYPTDGIREASASNDVTDEHGRFRFDRLAPDRYSATARGPHGFGRSDGAARVGLGQHVDNVVVMLEPAVDVDAKLIVEGTPPTPCDKPSLALWRDERFDLVGRADGPGHVRVDGVLPGTYRVAAGCADHELVVEAADLEVADHDVTGLEWKFVRKVTATIRGRVLADSGAPVSGAQVSTQHADLENAVSKPDGTYELRHVPPGKYQLFVSSSAGISPQAGWPVEVTRAGDLTRDLKLQTGGSLIVTVVDKDGNPLAGVSVSVSDQNPTTARDGTVRFANLPSSTHHVWVDGSIGSERFRDVEVRAGQLSTVKVVADPHAGTIRGVVIGSSSQPRGDVFVVASLEYEGHSNTHEVYDDRARVLTGTDGTFSITGLKTGLYGVRAYEPGGAEAIVEHVKPGTPVRLQIKSTGSIAGTIRTTDGIPDDVKLSLIDTRTSLRRKDHFYRTGGRYHFDDLPAGTYQVSVTDGDLDGATTVELAEGARLTNVDLKLDGSVTITGRVLDIATKLPVAGVPVAATLDGGSQAHNGESGADGRFTITDLPAGTLDVEISRWNEDYSSLSIKRAFRGVVDLGDFIVAKRRYKEDDKLGRFGITFGADSLRIDEIDPTGPAARSELAVGDVITAIDGIDLAGAPVESAWWLLNVPAGTAVRFASARGVTITIVAIPR